MSDRENKGLRIVLICLAAIITAAGLVFAVYMGSGPHSASEAVLRTPLAGKWANYEANGTISVNAEITEADIPQLDVPFRFRVVGAMTLCLALAP